MTIEPGRNLVPYPPSGLIVAIQHWHGDEAAAFRLARLMADIEPRRRDDVTLMFCRRFDTPVTPKFWETFLYCGAKFGVAQLTSRREGTGHPTGANELWAGIMDQLAGVWRAGTMRHASVFFAEADGCPLKRDWLALLLAEHERAVIAGKRVSGAFMRNCIPHINGSMIMHLSTWLDRPSLRQTPPEQAWDLFHAAALMQEAQPTTLLYNPYGAREWSDAALTAVAHDTAYLLNTKDDSAIAWAERTLVAARAPKEDTMPTNEKREAKPETFLCPHCHEPASAHTMDDERRLYCPPAAKDEKPPAAGRRVSVHG